MRVNLSSEPTVGSNIKESREESDRSHPNNRSSHTTILTASPVDILLQGGFVVDGDGRPARSSDVAIRDGRVIAVEPRLNANATSHIDATGLTIIPGLIDPHSHSDWSVLANRDAQSTIRQGVTTEVVGNCGVTYAPIATDGAARAAASLATFGYEGEVTWRKFSDLLSVVHGEDSGTAQNLAWFVGHTTLRDAAGIQGRRPDYDSMKRMSSLLVEALEAGALGMSTGLEYGSGRDADTQELLGLATVLTQYNGIYASHIRNRDARLIEAVSEFFTVAEASGHRAQLSHLNVRHDTGAPESAWHQAVNRLAQMRESGFDVLADITPYTHGIGVATGLLPAWFLEAGPGAAAASLNDKAVRARLRKDCDRYWRFVHKGQWDRVSVATSPGMPEAEGLTIPELANRLHSDAWDSFFDVLESAGSSMGSVQLIGRLFTPEHVAEAVAHPLFALGVDGFTSTADGILSRRTRHPLFFSGHTHYIAYHVLRAGTLPLEEAIRKMTSLVADRFELEGRGRIRVGSYADIAILDLSEIQRQDTFVFTGKYAQGVPHVIVNGRQVVKAGKHLGVRAGRYLPSRSSGT